MARSQRSVTVFVDESVYLLVPSPTSALSLLARSSAEEQSDMKQEADSVLEGAVIVIHS
jgi:hypothetical protein